MNLFKQISFGHNLFMAVMLSTFFFTTNDANAQCVFPLVQAFSQSGGTCPGDTRTLTVFGNLNDATQWTWYITICGGPIVVGTGSSVQVHPSVTSFYYVKGTGGCVGTQASCASLLVTVVDNDPPFALCQSVPTVYPDANCVSTITVEDLDVGSFDACGPVTMTVSPTQIQGFIPVLATLTVVDGSGNVDSCSATVRIEDTIPPVITCIDSFFVYLNFSNPPTPNLIHIDSLLLTVSDNCFSPTITSSLNIFGCNAVGVNHVVLTAHELWNTSRCTTVVTIYDTVPPLIGCSADTILIDPGSLPGDTLDAQTLRMTAYTDACGLSSYSFSPPTLDCSDAGLLDIISTISDPSGNLSSCATKVLVEDTVPPVALCKSAPVVYLDDNGEAVIQVSDVDNGSSDNCGIANITVDVDSVDCFHVVFDPFVTLVVEDHYGNKDSCRVFMDVQDTIPPYLSCSDDTIYLGLSGRRTLLAMAIVDSVSDNCSVIISPSFITYLDCGDIGVNPVSVSAVNVPSSIGPSSTCNVLITVLDTMPPVVRCDPFASLILDATGNSTIVPEDVLHSYLFSDNCGIDTITVRPNTFDCSNLGGNPVLVTAVDVNGNVGTCKTVLTVSDSVPPVALCKNVTVELGPSGQATVVPADADDGSYDDCGSISSMSVSPNTFDCGDLGGAKSVGTSTATLTVTDASGNSSDCTFLVFVEDNLAPTITCPSSRRVNTDPGTCDAVVLYPDPVAVDNCPIVTALLVEGLASGSTFPIGLTSVKYVAFDTKLNVDSCRFTVLVEDRERPVVTCPSDTTLIADSNCEATYSAPLATYSDNCPGVSLITKPSLPATFSGAGTYFINYTAVDAAGNGAGCLQRITVVSSVVANAGDDAYIIINSGTGTDPKPCDTLSATASGGAGSYTYSWVPTTGLSDPASATTEVCPTESTTYYFTATDAAGCSATDTVYVEVIDLDTDTLPAVGNNSNKIYVCDLTTCTTIQANANANCASPTSLCYLLSNGAVLGECTCKTATNNEPENGLRLLAFPNPFTSRTTIQFSDGNYGHATLEVFDLKGSMVASLFSGDIEAGKNYRFEFDASHLSQQMFIARITTNTKVEYLKVLLLK